MASPQPAPIGAGDALSADHPSRWYGQASNTTPANPYLFGLRLAWLGRVSTDDLQDPTLSLPRQLHKSRAALPTGSTIVAHFYDVESGRKELSLRGMSLAHEKFDIAIPRDGGIKDLLTEARRPDRRFDAVICESIDRVARRTYYGTKVEHDLEAQGVALFAADEPITLTGKRATTILTRRVKQGVAEWYVLETLEKSWDGLSEHTRQGWNVGRAPYGYRGDKVPHPVPARRAEGKSKTKLAPDPLTGPAVTAIFTWRVAENLGYQGIADRLNADLDRYPAPVSPDPARVRPDWSRTSVLGVLTNPKYTGYMVWNRRASKKGGKVNPPDQWVWSPLPTHEPLVTREMFQAAQTVGSRKGSRSANTPNAHPATKRVYALRSYVFCSCGLRMFGKTVKGITYYVCQPSTSRGKNAAAYHPGNNASSWAREDVLLAGLGELLNERLFGPHRRDYLDAAMHTANRTKTDHAHAHRDALTNAIDQLAVRQERLLTTLETQDDPEGNVFARVRERLAALERERSAKITELRDLAAAAEPVDDPGLLDELPELNFDLAELPVELQRELFDALQLRIDFDRRTGTAHGQITLTEMVTGVVEALVRPDVAPVIDIRAIQAGRATGSGAGRPRGDPGLPRTLRVGQQWPLVPRG